MIVLGFYILLIGAMARIYMKRGHIPVEQKLRLIILGQNEEAILSVPPFQIIGFLVIIVSTQLLY